MVKRVLKDECCQNRFWVAQRFERCDHALFPSEALAAGDV